MGLCGLGGSFHSSLFSQMERPHASKGLGWTLQGEECFPQLFLFRSLHEKSAVTIFSIPLMCIFLSNQVTLPCSQFTTL